MVVSSAKEQCSGVCYLPRQCCVSIQEQQRELAALVFVLVRTPPLLPGEGVWTLRFKPPSPADVERHQSNFRNSCKPRRLGEQTVESVGYRSSTELPPCIASDAKVFESWKSSCNKDYLLAYFLPSAVNELGEERQVKSSFFV